MPDKFMRADYGIGLRRFIAGKGILNEIIDFGHAQVFDGVTTYTCLLFISGSKTIEYRAGVNIGGSYPQDFLRDIKLESHPSNTLTEATWSLSNSLESVIMNKIDNLGTKLPKLAELLVTGVKTGANSIFIFDLIETRDSTCLLKQEDGTEIVELESNLLMPYWKAESMKRYYQTAAHRLLLYPYKLSDSKTKLIEQSEMEKYYPLAWQYLNNHKESLENRQKGKLKGDSWYGLSFASDLRMFLGLKIVTPTLAMANSFTIDREGHLFPQGAGGGCGIVPASGQSELYLIGILNSSLLTFYFQRVSSRFQGGFFAYEPRYLRQIPIRMINGEDLADVARHDRMVALVEQMLYLHKQLPDARTPHDQTALQRQIEATDRQIDALVYELYGLTEEEIAIVEGRG